MSFQLMREVFESSKSKASARIVLLNLAEHANLKTRTAWPSKETIARECQLTVRGVQKHLRYLENVVNEIQLIGSNKGGYGRSNRYKLLLPKDEQGSPKAKKQRKNLRAPKGEPYSPEPEEPKVPPLKNTPPLESTGRLKTARADSSWQLTRFK